MPSLHHHIRWLGLLLLLLTGCGQPDMFSPEPPSALPTDLSASGSTAVPMSEAPSTAIATPTLTYEEFWYLKYGAELEADQAQQTIAAGGTLPTVVITEPEILAEHTAIAGGATLTPEPLWITFGITYGCTDGTPISFRAMNCWNGEYNGTYVFVHAGGDHQNPQQGGLRIYTKSATTRQNTVTILYSTPAQAGLIEVIAAEWPYLQVATTDPDQPVTYFVFNLETRQWEDLSVFPTPLATPTP